MGKWIASDKFIINVLHYVKHSFKRRGLEGLRDSWCVNPDALRLYLPKTTFLCWRVVCLGRLLIGEIPRQARVLCDVGSAVRTFEYLQFHPVRRPGPRKRRLCPALPKNHKR
jgi:hypothetical protein